MNRLSVRLMAAFGMVLIMTLIIMWFALLVVLRARPVNTDSYTIDLAANLIEIRDGINRRDLTRGETLTTLEEQAELQEIRLLIVRESDTTVIFDTDGSYPRTIRGKVNREPFIGGRADRLFSGQFEDEDSTKWIYVGQPAWRFANAVEQQNLPRLSIWAAEPLPQQTFRTVLQDYEGSGLFLALIQAVFIGMFFAFIVSFVMVRWIVRPLHHIAHAASHLAQGDYSTRTEIKGPNEVQMVASTFNDMAARVELTQQAQRDFLANVSHDLRTPLTSIQGFAQAIAEGVADADSAKRAGSIIQNEAARLNRMVSDLLDLARIQAGRMDMLRRAVELDSLLQVIGESFAIHADSKKITLHLDIPPLPRIAGDGDRLSQVFTNLVDNALKHTPENGHIWLRAELDHQKGILIQVEDTGEGIPQADLPRIFERFYQVDKSRAKRAGTGLGLAITQEIITIHKGRIWVESEPNKGTRFSVWLPQSIHESQETVVVQREKT